MTEIVLRGCTPEPLMGYLKALAVLRLVAEQADSDAAGCWRDGVFVLRSKLNDQNLVEFFIHQYRPTPIVVPWSGGDFFDVDPSGRPGPFKKTPTSSRIIEAFLGARNTSRFDEYRSAISSALRALRDLKITTKATMEDKRAKTLFIAHLRSTAVASVARWIDAAAILVEDKASFSAFLGSGGGSDGNTHFSDNFMQNLWEVLPDFAPQRSAANPFDLAASTSLLRNALSSEPSHSLVPKRTSALFDGGAVGGQNAGQGFERVSFGNPWAVVLCLEGTLLLAGAVARRQEASQRQGPSFPFLARLTPTRIDSAADKETSGREAWLPIWSRWTSLSELESLFSEGRSSVGRKPAQSGLDFARAATSLGVDRGIASFYRYAIVKGRVGGDNYNTSASLGRFEVCARADVDVLREIDPWLDRFRAAASDDKAPPRFRSALRRLESAIFEFCRFGGAPRFAGILCALGRAERELAAGERFREEKHIQPIPGLSSDWIRSSFDGSVEFELALALAGIGDSKIGTLRANLEPAAAWTDTKGRPRSTWLDKDRAVVWNSADLSANLSAVLGRRLMDGARRGSEGLPLFFQRAASPDAIAAFIAGETDDERIEELLWGFVLVEQRTLSALAPWRSEEAPPLPRSFALLRLLFLPYALEIGGAPVAIPTEPSVLPLLGSGHAGAARACGIALRRLVASGLVPLTCRRGRGAAEGAEWWSHEVDPRRLAAALLFPIGSKTAGWLAGMVARASEKATDAVG